MKSVPLKLIGQDFVICSPEEATHLRLNRPGPYKFLMLPVTIKGKRDGTNRWTWNGDVENPTIRPSVRTIFPTVDDDGNLVDAICHSWITDGKIIFLEDSTHELSGQTLDLLEVE